MSAPLAAKQCARFADPSFALMHSPLLHGLNRSLGPWEMPEKLSEKSDMSSVEFCQHALRDHVAPPSLGSVKTRLRHATRQLNWTPNRVKDAWYADPRISPSADEIRDLEALTGLRYGREELREIDSFIARADALLEGPDADLYRPIVAALRAFHRAVAGTGIEGRRLK